MNVVVSTSMVLLSWGRTFLPGTRRLLLTVQYWEDSEWPVCFTRCCAVFVVSPLCFQKAQSFCNYFLHVCSKELLSFAYFQLLTDNVSYSLGNAGKKNSASPSAKGLTEEEEALLRAIRPLVTNPDCHFLAVLTVLVQSILEGRTDCPISGVFGAGKTRAAAAMIAGLLVMDPTLKVMVVTKENAAAHAFAKHIESLQLPPSLEEKFGRLVGATELEKGPASQTKLDVLPGFRNTVLRTKQVIIEVAEVASTRNVRSHTAQ